MRWILPIALAAREAQRSRGNRIDAVSPAAADFHCEGAGVGFEGGLGRGHAAAVARDRALARHVGEREEAAAGTHHRREGAHQRHVAVGAHAHRVEIAAAARLEQRQLHLGSVGQAVHHDVEALVAEVLAQALRRARDGEVAPFLVALVFRDVGRDVGHGVESRVERIDPLELERLAVREPERVGHLPALKQLLEDAERRRPGAHAYRRARIGQGLGDGEPESRVVGHARDERALACEINGKHLGKIDTKTHRLIDAARNDAAPSESVSL